MAYAVVALLLGVGVGLMTGGRLRNLGEHRLAAWWVLPIGVGAQLLSNQLEGDAAFALLLLSYVLLAAFTVANIRLFGMVAVTIGLLANLLVIAVNEGMPVRREAVIKAGIADDDRDLATISMQSKHHYERPSDDLMILADIIPVRPLREVLSIGDVAMSAGIAAVVATLLRKEPSHPLAEQTRSLPSEG